MRAGRYLNREIKTMSKLVPDWQKPRVLESVFDQLPDALRNPALH
jgi:hypothetical protein